MKEIKRNVYLEKINKFTDKPVIKVIIGMRRVGKSVILRQLYEDLKSRYKKGNFIYINKEDLAFDFISNYKQLCVYINDNSKSRVKNYIFIDEIQEIDNWEKCIASLAVSKNNDIYITGSNSSMLSSEISTLIAGRYILFHIYPLTFKEFLIFRGEDAKTLKEEFDNFINFGGFPGIHYFDLDKEIIYQYIKGIYSTIILKDIVSRYGIRSVSLLENVYIYLMDNIGNITSANRIKNYIKDKGLKTSVDSILNYFYYLTSTYAMLKILRYDIKGKKILEFSEKFYAGDLGLHQIFNRNKMHKIPGILENIVLLELKSRGYEVQIGKMNGAEIDFFAQKGAVTEYFQISYLIKDKDIFEREYSPLLKINDNYPKYVLSMDEIGEDYKGIKWMNIIDWLIADRVTEG